LIATAATAPYLETAILGGKPISVLYVTRDGDTVLVRCYPNYQPIMKVRAMGSNPDANTQKEVLTDLSKSQTNEKDARHLALHDSLTGLPKRCTSLSH